MVELALVAFPVDDAERARRFWEGLLGVPFPEREEGDGRGWQTREGGVALGLHERGPGPGDRFSLPYFAVADVDEALARVKELGGEVIHPGDLPRFRGQSLRARPPLGRRAGAQCDRGGRVVGELLPGVGHARV